MDKLKPCPFCGGKAVFMTKQNNSSHTCVSFSFAIECSKCHTRPPKASDNVAFGLSSTGEIVTIDDGREKAIEAWNRRAADTKEIDFDYEAEDGQ
jgi:Lar family restriction alleviation protein